MVKETNLSDQILTVAGIKVLGNVDNAGFRKIKESVEQVQQSVNQVSVQTQDFWSNLSKDGVISRTEKKTLKKEYESIDQTHTALMAQARTKGCENTSEVIQYDFAFEDLHDYLFVTLKLFDDMGSDTPIESAEVFNSYYNTYAFKLQNAQSRVNIGDPGKIRTLTSLLDAGTDGEVALFEDNFYRYDLANHEWINIEVASSLGEYKGVLTESPPMVPNQFFLVGPEGIVADTLLFDITERTIEDNAWVDQDGELIYINYGFEIGYIYYYDEQTKSFIKVADKNNWRYITAMNDIVACGWNISPELYAYLTGNVAAEIEKKTQENVLQHIPQYLGKRTTVLSNPNNGDWMLWATTSTSLFTKGHLYVWQAETSTWEELDPSSTDGKVQDMFMTSLNHILEVNPTETGYFAAVFANSFYSNQANIDKLNASQIVLKNGGLIKSHGYVYGQSGFCIKDDGSAIFNEVEIGGYATTDDLSAVEGKADAAASAASDAADAASSAQSTANTAVSDAASAAGAASDAATAASTAQDTADKIVNGTTSLDNLTGQLVQDSTAPTDLNNPKTWAIRTQGYHPDTSAKGFGITKDGRVFANDGQFNGVLSIGSQQPTESGTRFIEGTYVGDGVIDTGRITANESLRIKDHCVFEKGYIRFLSALATRWCTDFGKPNDMTLFNWLKYWLFPLTESLEPSPCLGGMRLSLASGPSTIEGIAVNIGYTSAAKNAIGINIISVNNAAHYSVKIPQSGSVTVDGQPYNVNSYYLGTISSVRP